MYIIFYALVHKQAFINVRINIIAYIAFILTSISNHKMYKSIQLFIFLNTHTFANKRSYSV